MTLFAEAAEGERVDAWLMRDGGRWPLRRIVEEPEPITLPGMPTRGAEGQVARKVAHRLEDVRIAAAMLCGAAEKAELAIVNEPALFGRLVRPRSWTAPALAALEPLRLISEACMAFEEAVAGARARPADVERVLLPNDARDIPADIARNATFAVPIAREDRIVDRRVTRGAGSVTIAGAASLAGLPEERAFETIAKAMATADAVDRLAPALAKAEAVRRHVDAIDRAAPLIAAVDALGPDARLASRALSAAETRRPRPALPHRHRQRLKKDRCDAKQNHSFIPADQACRQGSDAA